MEKIIIKVGSSLVEMKLGGDPEREGLFLVLIESNNGVQSRYEVDYCRKLSPTDGGGYQWDDRYTQNVLAYAEMDVSHYCSPLKYADEVRLK